jgi:hypothetical protein
MDRGFSLEETDEEEEFLGLKVRRVCRRGRRGRVAGP